MKTAEGSHEVRGKTLGIIGYGNIGSQLAMLAEAMGMRVIFYDHTDKLQHGTVRPAGSMRDVLEQSDVVSLHLPETEQTRGIIGEPEIRAMKRGAFFINNARGTLVDIDALARALADGHLAGAAIDVFPVEPGSNSAPFESPLQGLDNVILTPHVGGSTQEAQHQIGAEVARKLVDYSDIGSTMGAVNFPQVQLPVTDNVTRFLQVQRNIPGELQRLNEVFARRGVNIAAQYFQTDGEIGYVVLDAQGDVADAEAVVEEIRALPGTVRARRLNSAA
jgi:D-3-phosphoglycerate dehydrogenase